MRWIVMAQSKVYMTIPYAVMAEIQKTSPGYRVKLQYDSRALTDAQADAALELLDSILHAMLSCGRVGELMRLPSGLTGLWKS